DGRGAVWAAFPDRGIQYLTLRGEVRTLEASVPLCREDRITFLYGLADGSLLAAGYKGYYRLTRESMEGPFYPLPDAQGRVTYALDTGGEMGVLLACDHGVFSLSGEDASLVPLPYDELGTRSICLLSLKPPDTLFALARNGRLLRWGPGGHKVWNLEALSPPLTNAFFEMDVDRRGILWIATGDGLFQLDGEALSLFTEQHGLSSVWVNHLLIDREGNMWLGTEAGLDRVSSLRFRNYRYRESLPVNSVWPIMERPDRSVWVGTNNGLLVVEPDGRARMMNKPGSPRTAVVDMKTGRDGRVWLLTYEGVLCWTGSGFLSYPTREISSFSLWNILPLRHDEIWVSTSNGVYALDPGRRSFRRHPVSDRVEGVRDLNNLVLRPNGEVFLLGRKVHVWKTENTVEEVPLPPWAAGYSLYDIIEQEGQTWVLADEGLLRLRDGAWTHFPLEGKIPFDIVCVRPGEFWLGCSSGIARFDGQRFEYFGLQDGVAVEECNTGAKLLDSRGRVWLGGKNITIINTEAETRAGILEPLITRAAAGDRVSLLPVSMEMRSRVRSLEIQYATPSFVNEHKILHRTRMSPLEDSFGPPTREKSIRYANLAPGRYTFQVQAGEEKGPWNGIPAELSITVKPAFWQTRAARVTLLLMLVAGGILLSAARVRHLEKQRVKLQRIVDTQTGKIKEQRDEMARLATLDPLTNLANRRKFLECLEAEAARVRRTGRPLSVLMMDIDHFKTINDSFGHAAGDEVLKDIARRAARSIRETDTLARWGGDEFVLLMPETGLEEARLAARRLKDGIEAEAFTLPDGRSVGATLSLGVACRGDEKTAWMSVEILLQEADTLLYRAKASGRNRVE
ncbi:MAG: diguanylate cyclase, partial [Candidatus Aminicenantes bacterium]|nr:diguanylate cyclase [Candidatus Aminicenantes bacterium]